MTTPFTISMQSHVVVDALSRKSSTSLACLMVGKGPLQGKLRKMNVELMVHEPYAFLAQLKVKPTLIDKIKES